MMKEKPERLNVFHYFLENDGEIMLVMEMLEGEADDDNARFVFDENGDGYLVRNAAQTVDVPAITDQFRDLLYKNKTLLVTEMNGSEIADVYEAAIISKEAFAASLMPQGDNPKLYPL